MLISDLMEALTLCYLADIPVMLWGDTGIGKTAIIKEFGRLMEIDVVSLFASQFEGEELRGIPYIDRGTVKFAGFDELPKHKPFILFLDELSRGGKYALQAMYQLINEKKIGTHAYDCYVIAACNPDTEDFVVTKLDKALLYRFIHIAVEPDAKSLKEYLSKDYDKNLLQYVDKLLITEQATIPPIKYCSPRQIEWVFKLIQHNKKLGISEHIFKEILAGVLPKPEIISITNNITIPKRLTKKKAEEIIKQLYFINPNEQENLAEVLYTLFSKGYKEHVAFLLLHYLDTKIRSNLFDTLYESKAHYVQKFFALCNGKDIQWLESVKEVKNYAT